MTKYLALCVAVWAILLTGQYSTFGLDAPAASPAATPAAAPLNRVKWIGLSADWNDGKNWSTGQVPTEADRAVFDQEKIKNQPTVTGTVKVGGIDFVSGGGKLRPNLPGEKSGHVMEPSATWAIAGSGTIVVGAGGISSGSTNIIYPAIQLDGPQKWTVGAPYLDPALGESWDDVTGTNGGNIILLGQLSGTGPLVKINNGKLYYCNNSPATFSGGTNVLGGWVDWTMTQLDGPVKASFGTGPIALDGGCFTFGASMCKDKSCIPDLTNPISVGSRGARLFYSQEGPTPLTPDSHFSGPIDLGGPLTVGHSTVGAGASDVELLGPIVVNQQSAGTPLILFNDSLRDLAVRGPVSIGPGDAGNPLILQSDDNIVELSSPNSTFDGLTVIGLSGGQAFDIVTNSGLVDIDANSRLGKAGVLLEPGGRLNLNSANSIPIGAPVTVQSNSLTLGALGVTYNGLPAITPDSSGVLTIDSPVFDAVTDLSKLGNGHMWLGARDQGAFTGNVLAPGAGNVYRLGCGSFGGVPGRGWPGAAFPRQSGAHFGDYLAPDHWLRGNPSFMDPKGNPGSEVGGGVLTIAHGVLTGDAGLDVGSVQLLGNSDVVLEGNNTFTGPIHVAGAMQSGFIIGFCCRGSTLEGVEQVQPGQSPLGSDAGAVDLLNSTLKLTAVPNGQPVRKGELTYAGASTISLDSNVTNLASLTVSKLARLDRAVLTVDPQQEKLGDAERLLVGDMTKDVDLLPPYMLYSSTKEWPPIWGKTGRTFGPDRTTGPDFLAYDATGKTGVVRFSHYATDLASAKPDDVVRSGPTTMPAGDYTVRALRTTGKIQGQKATVKITSGGLILADDFAPNLDFGSAEGIIYGTNINSATGGYSALLAVTGKISGSNGLTMLGGPLPWGYDFGVPAQNGTVLANPANDFTGMVTIEGEATMVVPDAHVKGAVVHGSLGDLQNPITLNGGILSTAMDYAGEDYLAGTRVVHLGVGGGYVHANRHDWKFDAKITGPGFLSQTQEGAGTLIVANPDNDYTGGTLVEFNMHATANGKLGAGPVAMAAGTVLVLEGDRNIDPRFRLSTVNSSSVSLESAHPQIGSIDGTGLLWLGSDSSRPPAKLATSTIDLSLGADNTDFTFFGAIRQAPGITGSVAKVGSGTFTLYGAHDYTGPTTVSSGALVLMGSVAGDVIVQKGATFTLKGTVAGNVQVQPGGIFHNGGHIGGKVIDSPAE